MGFQQRINIYFYKHIGVNFGPSRSAAIETLCTLHFQLDFFLMLPPDRVYNHVQCQAERGPSLTQPPLP